VDHVQPKVTLYTAPEARSPLQVFLLHGAVYNHPKFTDGTVISTSAVAAFDNNTRAITTTSGSSYILDGDPDPLYADYLAQEPGMDPLPPLLAIIKWQCPYILISN